MSAKPKFDLMEEGAKEPPPDLSAVPKLAKSAKKLTTMVLQRTALSEKIKALEEQKKEIDSQILPMLYRAECKRVLVEGHPVVVVESNRSILEKTLLIEEGVDPELIKRCTRTYPNSPHVRVYPKRVEE